MRHESVDDILISSNAMSTGEYSFCGGAMPTAPETAGKINTTSVQSDATSFDAARHGFITPRVFAVFFAGNGETLNGAGRIP